MRRRTWRLVAAMFGVAALVACGGGGGSDAEASDGNLYVTFEYPQQVQTFAQFSPVAITPVVEGLGNGRAHCRVRDGSGATLPEGMSLNEQTGVVSGYAGQAGSAYVWVDMTVEGYDQAVSSLVSVNVTSSIVLSYPPSGVNGRVNAAIAPQQPTLTGLQSGDAVTNFRLCGIAARIGSTCHCRRPPSPPPSPSISDATTSRPITNAIWS